MARVKGRLRVSRSPAWNSTRPAWIVRSHGSSSHAAPCRSGASRDRDTSPGPQTGSARMRRSRSVAVAAHAAPTGRYPTQRQAARAAATLRCRACGALQRKCASTRRVRTNHHHTQPCRSGVSRDRDTSPGSQTGMARVRRSRSVAVAAHATPTGRHPAQRQVARAAATRRCRACVALQHKCMHARSRPVPAHGGSGLSAIARSPL